MKKILTLIIFALCSLPIQAQNFSAEVLDTTIYAHEGVFTFEGWVDLYNHTFGDLTLQFENIEQSVPAGWQTSNCLGMNCLPIGVTSGAFPLMVQSPDNYIIGHFYPNNVAGTGYMKIKLYEIFNPNDSIVITYYGVAGNVMAVEELKQTDVLVFPNPASDILTIMLPNDGGKELKLEVIDALGRVVKLEITTQSTTQINISDLSQGVYFVAVGNVRHRIIKQ